MVYLIYMSLRESPCVGSVAVSAGLSLKARSIGRTINTVGILNTIVNYCQGDVSDCE